MNKFIEAIDDMLEIITGEKPKRNEVMTKRDKGFSEEHTQQWLDWANNAQEKPKRARGKKGRYKADDKSTPNVNEAWVGGKAPNKRKKKNAKK